MSSWDRDIVKTPCIEESCENMCQEIDLSEGEDYQVCCVCNGNEYDIMCSDCIEEYEDNQRAMAEYYYDVMEGY